MAIEKHSDYFVLDKVRTPLICGLDLRTSSTSRLCRTSRTSHTTTSLIIQEYTFVAGNLINTARHHEIKRHTQELAALVAE
jgi:hypothetical protein